MQRKNAPETQFSLVNDTSADQKTFGEPNANLKTFGKSNATVKLRLAPAKSALPSPSTGGTGGRAPFRTKTGFAGNKHNGHIALTASCDS